MRALLYLWVVCRGIKELSGNWKLVWYLGTHTYKDYYGDPFPTNPVSLGLR